MYYVVKHTDDEYRNIVNDVDVGKRIDSYEEAIVEACICALQYAKKHGKNIPLISENISTLDRRAQEDLLMQLNKNSIGKYFIRQDYRVIIK